MRKNNSLTIKLTVLLSILIVLLACSLPKEAAPTQAILPPTTLPPTQEEKPVVTAPPAQAPEVAVTLPAGLDITGSWLGTLKETGTPNRNYVFKAEFTQKPGDPAVSGKVEMIQGGNEGGESYEVKGTLEGSTLHIAESQGRFFFGSLQGNKIIGQAAWNCYDCEGWGQFELTRGATSSLPPTPSVTFAPSDIPFYIDCSALPDTRKADCDAFITATRDQAYSVLRDVTGVSLSKCRNDGFAYDAVYYKILPTDPAPGAGGFSAGNKITYNQRYSIDLPHRYDVHELLHTISACSGALDAHVFHGMILNDVYERMGVHDSGYFTPRDNPQGLADYLLGKIKTASGNDLHSMCQGMLSNKMTIAYFDLGSKAVTALYSSTVNPHPASAPSAKLVEIWGQGTATQVQSLLETLKNKYQVNLNVPECGY